MKGEGVDTQTQPIVQPKRQSNKIINRSKNVQSRRRKFGHGGEERKQSSIEQSTVAVIAPLQPVNYPALLAQIQQIQQQSAPYRRLNKSQQSRQNNQARQNEWTAGGRQSPGKMPE